jgi:hypothetical protein
MSPNSTAFNIDRSLTGPLIGTGTTPVHLSSHMCSPLAITRHFTLISSNIISNSNIYPSKRRFAYYENIPTLLGYILTRACQTSNPNKHIKKGERRD